MRLIDADALKESLKELEADGINTTYVHGLQDAIDCYFPQIIDDAPTIESEADKGWIIDKLNDRLDQAFYDAVNDAQDYNNPNVAQDALQDAYDNVRCWIYEILNGREEK